MYPLRALALLTLFASSSIAEPLRPSRSAGFHHTSSFGSEYSKSFSSGFGGEGLASEPIVQTKASYKGCSSATGCGGITLENGQITEKFGNPAALGLNGDVSANIDPAELHKKFALQAADINSAFAASLPSNGPFWWTSKDSPFKDTYETYLKWVKDNSFAAAPFTSPCGTSTCPFGSSFSQNKVTNTGGSNTIDIANNPFLNGQFAAGSFGATSGFTSGGATAGADLSKNPFLSGNVHSDGVNGQGGSTSFSSSFGTTGVSGPGINIQNNPFLNGAIATTGCGGKSTGCSQTTSFQQTTGTGAKPGFDVLNLDSNPFLSKPSGSIHVTGSSTTGCGGAACGGGTQITGFEQQQITTGFGGQAQQVTTGFGTTGLQNQQQITTGFGQIKPSGCGGAGCQGQQQITSNFQQTQDNSCSGPFCGQEQQTHQAFPPPPAPSNKPSGSNLPHPPGIAGQGFKETNVGGELTVTCIGEGNICVKKEQCVNGIVSNYGENILQLRSGIRCPISTEVCCKIKEKAPQSTSQTFTNSFQSTVGQNVQSTVGQNVQSTIGQNVQSTHPTGPGFQTPPSGNEQHFTSHSSGLIHVPGVPGEKHFGFEQQSYNQISGKPSKDVRPPLTGPGSTSIYKDSVVSQSEQQFSSPIFGNVQKQGTPYLPPVEDQKVKPYEYPEPENPYNPELIPFPTQPAPAKPTPYKPQPTPYQPQPTPAKPKPIPNQPQPTPYQPQPTPYQPQPTPYQPQPTPYKPQPTPYKPQPTPYQPQPTPNKPQPTPYVPKQPQPTPYQPQPTPYQPQPTPYQPQPTPYQPQPTPYQPQPTPYKPQPTPYQPKPTPYSPPVQRPTPSIKGPGYLPPPDESPQSSIGSQQIVPRPGDSEGGIILDETRDQRPKDNPIPIIPSGCAAALKCTPKEFCTADGIISNSTVRLTQAQEEFRVPLTDCKEPSTGVVGKCCRDPTYTDPWPTNQLGQWIPGAFGDTGAYKADQNRGIPPRGSNGANPQNDNRRPPPNNGFGLNPAGSINNPIYAANPNQVVPPKPGQYPSNQARPNNPAAQPNIPPNPAIYQNQQQNFPTGPSYPTGSQVNPGKATYPNTPVARPNGFPVGPTGISSPSNTPGSQVNTENLYTTGQLLLEEFQNAKNQNKQGSCGVRQGGTRPLGNKELFETDFGEIPWQAMILLQTNRTLLCGGVITSENIVVTSAHCIDGLDAKNVLVKGGEWKLGIDEEPRPFQIVQVSKIIKHPQYFTGSLQNDFAVLVLSEKLRYAPNIAPICLPPATQDANQRLYQNGGKYKCITTGWGKKVLQVNVPNSIMHSLDMSLISPPQCQAQISQNYPHLLENYDANTCICGQPSQVSANVCQVDIGSALACTSGDGAYYMEGVFSWDSGCQSSNQLAAFYKFDSFWYQSVSEGGNVQSSLFEQQQITNGFPGQPKPATQLGSYSTQSKQTVTKHGQSYAVNGQDAFNQSLGLGHAHTGAQCQCFEEGKK